MSIQDLINRAEAVRTTNVEDFNTAERIGGLMKDIVIQMDPDAMVQSAEAAAEIATAKADEALISANEAEAAKDTALANNELLGGIAYNAAAPTPGKSGKYSFTTGGSCTWLTGGAATVAVGDEVVVVFTAPSTYTYTKVGRPDIEQTRSQSTSKVPSSKLVDDELYLYDSKLLGVGMYENSFNDITANTTNDAEIKFMEYGYKGKLSGIKMKTNGTFSVYKLNLTTGEYSILLTTSGTGTQVYNFASVVELNENEVIGISGNLYYTNSVKLTDLKTGWFTIGGNSIKYSTVNQIYAYELVPYDSSANSSISLLSRNQTFDLKDISAFSTALNSSYIYANKIDFIGVVYGIQIKTSSSTSGGVYKISTNGDAPVLIKSYTDLSANRINNLIFDDPVTLNHGEYIGIKGIGCFINTINDYISVPYTTDSYYEEGTGILVSINLFTSNSITEIYKSINSIVKNYSGEIIDYSDYALYKNHYIGSTLAIGSSANHDVTGYIPVEVGDIVLYEGNMGTTNVAIASYTGINTGAAILLKTTEVLPVYKIQITDPTIKYIRASSDKVNYNLKVVVIKASFETLKKYINTSIKTTRITVESTANYAIRTAIANITDNSYWNRYEVYIPNGNYFEMDIVTKDYVTLIGQSKSGVIISCDYNSTINTPENCFDRHSGTNLSNIPINTINRTTNINALHILFCLAGHHFGIKNLTLIEKDFKYCIHHDNLAAGAYWFNAFNCKLINNGGRRPVGIGTGGGEEINYENCVFESYISDTIAGETDYNYCIGFHNNPTYDYPAFFKAKNCLFNTGFVDIREYESGQNDFVVFENCKTTSPNYTAYIKANDAAYSYDTQFNMINCTYIASAEKVNRDNFQIIEI